MTWLIAKKSMPIVAIILSLIFLVNMISEYFSKDFKYTYTEPASLSEYTPKAYIKTEGDYYVAPDGNDGQDGTAEHPFATIAKARDALRELKELKGLPKRDIVVCIKAGEYRVDTLSFTQEDSGNADCRIIYRAYGDGDVVINGGVTLRASDAVPIGNYVPLGINKDVKDHIRMIDLNKYGITSDQIGKIYAFGSYNTASKYDGDTVGPLQCELFYNDKRMTLARYPNGDTFAETGKIIDNGDTSETYENGTTVNPDWNGMRNPRGGTFQVSSDVGERLAKYHTLKDVWLFGYFKWDWADSTTPIKQFNASDQTLTTTYASTYGFDEGRRYYIFNALEELDSEGEWYLDRTNRTLYLYAPDDIETADMALSLSIQNLLTANSDYLEFENIIFKGTRGDGLVIKGNHNIIKSCTVKNIAGNAVSMTGYDSLVSDNEICHVGRGGITLTGGDRTTLTPSGNVADNNLIHDWSEIYQTYQSGIMLSGVGNKCSHNELYNSPHQGISYAGNDNIVEYNILHDVVLKSSDAGAIYTGRRWDWYGNIIRYNCIYNIGSGGNEPCGIYMDDALSGQTIYGNVLVNIPSIAIHLGGGRDLNVYNNLIINAKVPISYDDRARDGALENDGKSWAVHYGENGGVWKLLWESPYQTPLWQERYPQCAKIISDFSKINDPYFGANPAFSTVRNNIIVGKYGLGNIADSVYDYSSIEDNAVVRDASAVFENTQTGDYRVKENSRVFKSVNTFEQIPFSQIGRY